MPPLSDYRLLKRLLSSSKTGFSFNIPQIISFHLGPLSLFLLGNRKTTQHLFTGWFHIICYPKCSVYKKIKISFLFTDPRTNLSDSQTISQLIFSRVLWVFLYLCRLVHKYRRLVSLADDLSGNSVMSHARSLLNNTTGLPHNSINTP